jgi:TolA-binding protein
MLLFGTGLRISTLVLALAPILPAQDGDLPERLFSSGERAYATKAYPEAVETWNQLLQAAPKSPFAAQALMRLARYQLEVEKRPDAALPFLDKVKAEHLKTPWAAEAMLMRGKILASRSGTPLELKEALAEFNRVVDLFPDSPAVQETRFQMGAAFYLQGQWGRALQNFTELLRLDPAAPLAGKAQLRIADILDLMGDTTGCLRALQALRNQRPDSPESQEAAWRIEVIVKQRLLKPPLHSQGPWPDGKVKWLKTPTLLATGPDGELYLYQDDLDRAFRLQNGQLAAAGPVAKDAKAMLVTPAGEPWLVTAKFGVVKADNPQSLAAPPVAAPSGAFLDGWGNTWLGDGKGENILVLSPQGSQRSLPCAATALAGMPGGGAVAACDGSRTLQFLDSNGRNRLSVPYGQGLPAPFKYVVALCADPCGHVAALVDGDFEGVVLWGPDGAVLRSATYKTLGIAGKFRSVALDRQGGIILADRSHDTLYRLD